MVLLLVWFYTSTAVFVLASMAPLSTVGTMNGKASLDSGVLHLTDTDGSKAGTCWYNEPVDLLRDWTVEFEAEVDDFTESFPWVYTAGGDGFAFVIQTRDLNYIGGYQDKLGYLFDSDDSPNHKQVGIEFDYLKHDDDADWNHAAVTVKNVKKLSWNMDTVWRWRDHTGDKVEIVISYILETKALTLKVGSFVVGSYTIDFDEELDLITIPATTENPIPSKGAYIGFAAATSTSQARHKIHNWSFSANVELADIEDEPGAIRDEEPEREIYETLPDWVPSWARENFFLLTAVVGGSLVLVVFLTIVTRFIKPPGNPEDDALAAKRAALAVGEDPGLLEGSKKNPYGTLNPEVGGVLGLDDKAAQQSREQSLAEFSGPGSAPQNDFQNRPAQSAVSLDPASGGETYFGATTVAMGSVATVNSVMAPDVEPRRSTGRKKRSKGSRGSGGGSNRSRGSGNRRSGSGSRRSGSGSGGSRRSGSGSGGSRRSGSGNGGSNRRRPPQGGSQGSKGSRGGSNRNRPGNGGPVSL